MHNKTLPIDLTWLDPGFAAAMAEGRLSDPFAVLGPHGIDAVRVVRVFVPGADSVALSLSDGSSVTAVPADHPAGLFVAAMPTHQSYRLRIGWPGGTQETEDPYSFGPLLGDLDLYLINEGRHFELADCLGASLREIDGVPGVRFAVWAPNARAVSIVGDFNSWDSRRHPMRSRHGAGVWELFVPRLRAGERYKYAIVGPDGTRLPLKADPVARATEMPPATASVVSDEAPFLWRDEIWMTERAARHQTDAPITIYELHAASWFRPDGDPTKTASWDLLADRLIPYVRDLGFTHIEFLPVTEHPFSGSWGYQPLGLFAPSARYGAPEGFARFVDHCHRAGIGVIVDWVPAHFPTDAHGLARFDGTALYEHLDPREGFHQDWNTYIYNLGRNEVQGFLIASALYWLEHFHIDGLRVDAVASMLYRDYSRAAGEWVPNIHGGRENLESVGFLRHLNAVVAERCPGAMTIAEESTAWPGVTRKVSEGGLGFDYKWNMGWMHDTLHYMEHESVHRQWHHNGITFGLLYAFSEHFILPLSHDEVVHGKGALISKMPGDHWQRFANLRAYFGFMWSHPGKKLLFMGCELAQWKEWNHDTELDWGLLADPMHHGMQSLVRDLNHVYTGTPALHQADAAPGGFRWVIGDDTGNSVFAYMRFASADAAPVLVVVNMTPVPRQGYRIGVPRAGWWREIINTDAGVYGGSNVGNAGGLMATPVPSHGEAQSLDLTLPPLATVLLRPDD